jgi:hypothetical protein
MFKNKLAIYISLVVMVGMFTQSCNLTTKEKSLPLYPDFTDQNPDLFDTSWLTDKPCSAPCWHEITPEKTSKENAILTVKRLPFVDDSKMFKNSEGVSFPCKIPNDKTCIVMSFDNDILEFLWITPNYLITIDQVVEKLGNPDGFSAYPTDPGGTGYYLAVIWKKRQESV